MKKWSFLLLSVLALPLLSVAQLKVGYFNPKLVLTQLDEYKQIESRVQAFAVSTEAEYNKKAEAFQTEVSDFQKKSTVLSDAKKREEEARLATKRQELAEAGSAAQLEIQKKQSELLKPLFDKITEAIRSTATEQKLDFVFNQSTNAGENLILFVDTASKSSVDITPKVLEKLKKKP